jgi:hypothetical protein
VERAYGILALHRRLVRDYEHRPASSESRVYWAMSGVDGPAADRHLRPSLARHMTTSTVTGAAARMVTS